MKLYIKYYSVIVFFILFIEFLMSFRCNIDNGIYHLLVLTPLIVYSLITMVKKKQYLYCCILALIYELFFVINIKFTFFRVQENAWRAAYDIEKYSNLSNKYILWSILLLITIYYLFLDTENGRNYEVSDHKIRFKEIGVLFLCAVFGVLILSYLVTPGAFSARTYGVVGGATQLSIFRICFLMGIIVLHSSSSKNYILKIECMLGAVVVFLQVFLSGNRYILVELVFLILFLNLSKFKKLKRSQWFFLIVILVGIYVSFTYVKIYITGTDLNTIMFTHERNIFYSLNAIRKNTEDLVVNTYWSTIKNLLPKSITGSQDLNTGGILIQYINKSIFENSGINMGAFYLAEAYANFKEIGIVIISMLLGIVLVWIEKLRSKNRSPFIIVMYYFLISQSYNIVYYGTGNYIKLVVYFSIFLFLITVNAKKEKDNTRK